MAQQSQGQSGGDNSFAPIWITVALFFAAYALWNVGHAYIVSAAFFLNMMQAKLAYFLTGSSDLADQIYLMETLVPASVEWHQLVDLMGDVGAYIRYPIIVILVGLAIYLYQSDITLKYRRAHNMKTLRAQEQRNWPAIMPVVNEDLALVDINTGPWAMALSPMEFARKYKLLKKNDALLDNPNPGEEMTASIRRGDAKRVFTLQLGPIWDGFDKAPPHVRALAAVFMARMNRDRTAAMSILAVLDKSFTEGKPDYALATVSLQKYQQSEIVQEIVVKHAYLLTVMASLLAASRDDGVMPSSDFLWLKTVDRRLWYMLNCVGRQTPFCEIGGPFAHWVAECKTGRRSLTPMIDEAIVALEIAVKEVKLSPKELMELEP
jgi:intracellular multiplication protein IcmP